MKLLIGLAFAACAVLNMQPASAQKNSKMRADRIEISYGLPKNPAHASVLRLLKEGQVLEKFKEFLSPLRLPRVLQLKVAGCDGESNAWYEDDAITVCYEYIDDILRNAPKETTPAGVTRADAIVGPTLEVFLHEVGHAVFDYLGVPIMGREEDAADQFAAYLLLQFAKEDARRLIIGTAYAYNIDASKAVTDKNAFADEHGLPAQRFYNILCMAYGTDMKLFADLVEKEYLPKKRAEDCEGEYEQVSAAMRKLIQPNIDAARAKQVRAKRWLKFDVE
jgi:Putative metallopeptidase